MQPPWAVRAAPRLLRVLLSQAVDRRKMPGEVAISMKSSDHTCNMYFCRSSTKDSTSPSPAFSSSSYLFFTQPEIRANLASYIIANLVSWLDGQLQNCPVYTVSKKKVTNRMLLEPKNHNQQIERVHRDSSSILLETFFGTTCSFHDNQILTTPYFGGCAYIT